MADKKKDNQPHGSFLRSAVSLAPLGYGAYVGLSSAYNANANGPLSGTTNSLLNN
jgi:hypothetical protein